MVRPPYTAVGVGQWENLWTEDFGGGPRLMLATDEERAAAHVVGDVLPPRDWPRGRRRPAGGSTDMKILGLPSPTGTSQPDAAEPRRR
jgi:hypothetical protein